MCNFCLRVRSHSTHSGASSHCLQESKGRCAPGTNASSRGTARYSTRSQQHRINRGVPSSIYPITSFSFPVYIGYVSFLNQDFPLHIARRDANPTCTVYVYTARDDIPSARNVYAYCRRRQQNFQNTVSALGRDARIISRQSRNNTSSASEGIETVRPYIAADDEAYGTREKAKRPVCSVRFRKTCPKSGTTRLIGKR